MDVRLPNGMVVTNVPEGTTQAELLERLKAGGYDVSWATPPEPKDSTILGEAKRGFQQFLSGARTGAGALFGSPEEAARAGLKRSEKIEAEAGEGPSLERAKRVYEERGLLPAAGQVLSDIPRLLAQQGTQIGATIGGAKVGAGIGAAVAGPPGALIGGGLGAFGANVPSIFGQAMQRQAATQIEEGKPVDISMGRAAAATAGSAALEAAGTAGVLGKTLVKRLLGVGDDAALAAARSKEDLVKAARATIAGGAVRGAAVEMPVEVAQSVLDRWQAGLDVTGDDALKEYGESLYAAGLVGGPIGGASAIPTRRAAQRALEEQEPLAPGQRRGETLEQTANRLNVEVQGLTGELQPPPPSPFLSPEQLASIAASENGFGKLVQYEEKLKQEPSSPERNASIQASREFRRRLEIESQQRQTEPGKAYPFDPYAPEPFQFKSSTELVDLINRVEDPADKLTKILEYRAEVKSQPASVEREQALKDSSALYDEINKFAQAQGFPAPTPFTLRASDLTAAGIDKKDPLFEQLKGKDINKPDDVDTVVKLAEDAQRRTNITPELFDRLEGLLTSVEAHIRDKPGSGFYGQRTYPKPSGTGVSVAGQPEPTVPTGGAEPSGRMGMVGPTATAKPTVPREKVARAPVDEFFRAKPRAEFARAIGASGGDELKARRDNPNLKAAVKGENLGGVLNALARSKSPVVAEVARRGAPAGTTVKIDDDAVEQYVGRSFLDDRFIIAEAKNLLALRDAIKNKTPFIETVVIDEDGNTKDVERVVQNTEIVRAKPYWMFGLKQKDITEFTLPQLEQAVDNKIAELGEDQLKLTATASAIRTGVAGGAYDPDTKTIRLAEYYAKDEGVVTHELVHAQVVEAVANPTKEQRPYIERLNKLYEHVKANAKERGLDFYGVSSIQEFIAEGMSNPRFQFFLNTIPYEKQSAWTKFVQTIADLLGIENNTAFLELLTVYDRITPPVKSKAKVAPARTPSQQEALAETFPPSAETAFEPGLEVGEPAPDPELLAAVKKLEAEREKAQKTKVLPKGQIFSLLSAVKGKLTISDTLDVSPDKNMRVLTAKSNGTFISELVNNSLLNKWLPPDKRPESNNYDVQESEEYIKDLLRSRDHAPYAVKEQLDRLNLQIQNLDDAIEQEKQLDILIRQTNAELQAASEERRAEEAELPAAEREAGDTVRAEGTAARKSLAKVAPQVSEKKFQELERRAKQPSKPEPAKEEPEEVKAIRAERAEKINQLQGVLEKILAKYGLKDVKFNLEEGMKDEGSYEGQLIKLALDLDNPVRTLRHEAIHALKELGFFTSAQWKVLTDRAKSEWVDKYLKNQSAVLNGKEVTRYEAYMDLYKGDQDKIIEEAIADAFGDFSKTKPPPGMMQAILKRMENLFKGIKQAFNQSGYQTAEDVFGQIEEGKLTKAEKLVQNVDAGASAKLSLRIMRGDDEPELEGKVTVHKVGKYFDDQIIDIFGRRLDYDNPEDFDRAVKIAFDEVKYQLQQNKSGLDWYEADIKQAFKDTIKIIPELKKEENRILFSVIAGIMSPQTNARDNWFIAANAYQHYTDTGNIPGLNPETGGLWQGGTTSANKKLQLEFLNKMIEDLGQKAAVKWLLSDHTVKEINEFRSKYGNIKSGIDGKLNDVKPGLYAFGPKVGPFVSNLNGIHDVTVDLWMTRTFNRYFGTMVGPDDKIIDAPTEPQRRAIKQLVNKVAENANIKPYQVQSVLWFYEQSLFSKLGTPAPSYGFSDGGRKFLESARRSREEGIGATAGEDGKRGLIAKPSLRAPDTKEFDTFFGDSKIVDKDDEPKVMYHGTARDITSFVPKQAGAIFVTDDPNFAETFSKMSADWMAKHADQFLSPEQLKAGRKAAIKQIKKDYRADPKLRDKLLAALDDLGTQNLLIIPSMYATDAKEILAAQYKDQLPTGPNIMPVFVRAENPFDFDNPDHIRRLEQYEAENRYTEASIRYELGSVKHGSWEAIENRRVQDAIKQLGFDGFYVKEGGNKNLAVYSSNQIKSAIGNVGAFDVTDPDIRKSLRTRWSKDRVNSLLAKYAYTTADNDTKAYAAFVRPEDFLNATATKEDRQILETERTPLDVERLAAQRQEIYLEIAPTDEEGVYDIKGHEGRHRMMALQDAGVPSVPVVLIKRPYGRITNATVVDKAYLKPQVFEAGKAPRGIFLREMIPINYAEVKNLKETFGGEADIRFSLRTLPTLPTDVTDRIKQTVIPRERPGMVGRLLDAISPRTFSSFRKEFVNGYDQLANIDRQAAEQIRLMGGTEQLADAKAESAAHFSDLGGGLAASAMGVNDRVGGIPVYVRKYIVEKDFKKIGPDYTTKAAAEVAAKKVGGQVFEQGYTTISNANGVKGLIAIFSQLAKYKKPAENEPSVFDQYQFWADVKRASRFIQNPKTGGYQEKLFNDPDDIKRAKQIEQAFPEFVDIQKEWTKYNDGLVDFMRDTGVISEAGAKEMKSHGDYFPFYRHLGEDDIQGPRLFQSIANVKSVKAAKGSEAAVTDFFETIVRNTQAAIQSGIKNVAARRATDQAMRIKEVFKLNRAESGPTVYRVLEDGKETYYRSQDPLFIDALKVLNQPDLPFIGFFAGPAKLLRNLVTKDPAFQLANMMRDSLSAYVSSGYKFTPIAATLKQYGSIIAGKSSEVEALRKAGVIGGYDYSQGVEASAEKLEKEMRKVAGAKTTLEKIASPVTSLWGALEKSSEASDAATRNEIYKRVLAETGNEAEALYQALEVMNFNRKGRSPIIRILTAAIPFMNARIQGLDVLYRAGMRPIFGKDATEQEKARLKTFWVRGMTMMALSSMYWVLTSDDEEYKKQEQEVRDNYWLFPSLGIKIPIPFEIGVMFKVIPERILEYSMGSDTGEDFRKSMGRHLFSTFGFNPIPQTFLPAFEITVNHSFFTQRPIITQGMENISPEYQVGPNTSKIAGAIGQSLGISPIKLDYLIQGYTGTMGMYAVNLFDSIFSMNDEAPKPSRRLEQMPVLRRFMVDPEARGQITAYYDLKNSVDQVVRTSNYLERSMDFEQYGKYMQENIKMLSARDYISDLEKTMKEFREMKNLIRISKMDADEKRDSITNIGRLEQQLTQNIKTLKKQLAAQQ